MSIAESDILKLARAGNLAPIWQLLDGYRQRLRTMVDLRMDARLKGRVDASDVIQDSLLEVNERLSAYLTQPEMPFFLWVRFITAQKLLQLHRHHIGAAMRDARREVPMQFGGTPEASTQWMAQAFAGSGSTPSQTMTRAEELSRVQQALDAMPEADREVLALRHFERLSNTEVAQILGLKESAASRRYLRALARLKDALGTTITAD